MGTLNVQTMNAIKRQFESGLAKVKYEFHKNLMEIDPLNKESLEKMLTVFNQRLVIFQHEFMQYLTQIHEGISPETCEFTLSSPDTNRIPEIATTILAGGGSSILVAVVPVGTSGFWLWTTTITAAAAIGSALGIPTGIATAGIGVVIGAASGVGCAVVLKKYRRKLLRNALLKKFDSDIASTLRAWAYNKIAAIEAIDS